MRRLTYSLALASPASKWVKPFCEGTCLATFSLWKLKKTNLPKKRERPVLKLMTRDGLSSALTTTAALRLGRGLADILGRARERSVGLQRGLRPWKDWWGWCFWRVATVEEKARADKKEDAAIEEGGREGNDKGAS